MFIEAVKQYIKESRAKIKFKYNPKYLHIGIIFFVYFVACAFLPFWLFIPFAILFMVFVPKFVSWYVFDFKIKK